MQQTIPPHIADALALAHPSWRAILEKGLQAMALADPDYLPGLHPDRYLPARGRLFAAFQLPFDAVRFVLVGEGPYPREASATGVCFMDGAVESLWSEKGLSKQVNRATSLRNFMKMLLVADGSLSAENTSGEVMADVARQALHGDGFIQTLTELQANLTRQGFLLLNATLVYRPDVPPVKDGRAWRPFLREVLDALAGGSGEQRNPPPTLVLWGKIAEQLSGLEVAARFPKVLSEHPYNISFIGNSRMQGLFGPMRLLRKQA